jgi:hypothetical protein
MHLYPITCTMISNLMCVWEGGRGRWEGGGGRAVFVSCDMYIAADPKTTQ